MAISATFLANFDQFVGETKRANAALQDVSTAAVRASDVSSKSFGDMGATIKGVAGAFGIAFGVREITRFAGSVFEAAGAIGDMSLKLGISTDAVQGFKAAAEQGGATLETVGAAIGKMNVNLATGSPSTIKALKDLKLEFTAIRALNSEEAFLAITDSVAKIPDPMERSRIQLELFGRASADLTPAIMAGFRGTADAASKMSTETIASLKRGEEAWKSLWREVVIVSGGLLASFSDDFSIALALIKQNLGGAAVEAKTFGKDIALLPPALDAAGQAAQFMATLSSDAMVILTAAQRNNLVTLKELGQLTAANALKVGVSAEQYERYTAELTKAEAAEKKAATAAEKHADAFDELRSSGDGWKGTLAQMNPVVVESIRGYLEAGVSQAALATAYGLTATAIKSVATSITEEQKVLTLENRMLSDTTKLWAEHYALKVSHGATALQAQLAQIQQWLASETAAARQAGINDKSYYDALAVLSKEKAASLMVDWTAVGENSKTVSQEMADKAKATYEAMLAHSENYFPSVIERFRLIAEAAQTTANKMVQAMGTAFEELTIVGQKAQSSLNPEKPSGVTVFGGGGGAGISGADLSLYGASLKTMQHPGLRISDAMSPFGPNGSITINSNVSVNGVFDATAKRQIQEAASAGLTGAVLRGVKVS